MLRARLKTGSTQKLSLQMLQIRAGGPLIVSVSNLKKIKVENASGIVVVPNWPNQPWYPLFFELLNHDPLILKPNRSLFLSPCRMKTHSRVETPELMAGKLSSRLC